MAATQERSLSQFPTAASILLTTLLFGSVVDGTSTSGYDSVKILVSDLADAILGDFTYTQDLNTDVKTIFGAINSIMVLSGTATPDNQDGANGQLYVKYASADYSVVALYVKLNNAWREISTGGGGGASVDMGTTVPSDASGSNGDMYVQYDGTTYAVIDLFVKINDAWRKSPYSRVVALTQSEYSQITPDTTTLYIITDAQSSYQTKTDNGLDTEATTIVGGINELHDSIGADVYNTNTSYTAGMYCIYNNTLYRCKEPTSGAWDSSKWEAKTITSLIEIKANSSETYTKTQVDNLINPSGVSGALQPSRTDVLNWNLSFADLPMCKAYNCFLTFDVQTTAQPSITHNWNGSRTISGGNLIAYKIDGNLSGSGASGSINSSGQLVWSQGMTKGIYVAMGTLIYS